jgi:hypothetical protein
MRTALPRPICVSDFPLQVLGEVQSFLALCHQWMPHSSWQIDSSLLLVPHTWHIWPKAPGRARRVAAIALSSPIFAVIFEDKTGCLYCAGVGGCFLKRIRLEHSLYNSPSVSRCKEWRTLDPQHEWCRMLRKPVINYTSKESNNEEGSWATWSIKHAYRLFRDEHG